MIRGSLRNEALVHVSQVEWRRTSPVQCTANAAKAGLEVFHIGLPDLGLCREAFRLRPQHSRLKFDQSVVEPHDAMPEFIGHTGPPGVDVALHPLHVFEIVGGDCSTFARVSACESVLIGAADSRQPHFHEHRARSRLRHRILPDLVRTWLNQSRRENRFARHR